MSLLAAAAGALDAVPPPPAAAGAVPANPPPPGAPPADPATLAARSTGDGLPSDLNSSPGSTYFPNEGTNSASSGPKLNGGQIAGILIGAVAGSVLIAALIAAAVKHAKRHRAGWRKDDLNGGLPTTGNGGAGHLDAAFGLSPMPSSASTAPGAAAEAGMGHNGAALQYPHSPYSLRPANGSSIEMQNSSGRNGLSPSASALSGVQI